MPDLVNIEYQKYTRQMSGIQAKKQEENSARRDSRCNSRQPKTSNSLFV